MEFEIGDSFVVKEDIWLEDKNDERNWVNDKPDDIRDGAIEKGTILLFSHLFHEKYLNFKAIQPGCTDFDKYSAEFIDSEVTKFMTKIR